jgi:hypothetical protein
MLALAAGLLAVLSAPAPGIAAARQPIYGCIDHHGFSNTTLLIVTTVSPAGGMTWSFPEAPSVVAQRLLTGLNNNSFGVVFKEANGVVPNLFFNVTLSETNAGTQQDTAYVTTTGLALPGVLWRESSGPAPYIGWKDAIDHLSSNMLSWLQNGWHGSHPCRLPDGTLRQSWP